MTQDPLSAGLNQTHPCSMTHDEMAARIYREAGLSLNAPVPGGAAEIAVRLGISIYRQPHALAEADVCRWAGRQRIVVRRELELRRANFRVAEMLARIAGVAPEEEASVAAELVAPPEPFHANYRRVGTDIDALAQPFAITLTAAALRLNEVVGTDLVIVCKSRPPIRRARGLLGRLPDGDLEQLAAKRTTRSVRKVRLRDDGNAIALMA